MGTLYLVATPIGHLEDITARALRTLSEVDFVICEDTRHSGQLLEHFDIRKEKVSLPAFAEGARAEGILERLMGGESAALVTDAGTPGVSDPGELLVREAVAHGIQVVPIPGASAVLAALTASGLPTARFHFAGFLPRKGEGRRSMLEELGQLQATLVFYESPRRLGETLAELVERWGQRRACVARELTKKHEEWVRGSVRELADCYASEEVRGEVVLMVEGRGHSPRWSEEEVRNALQGGLARGERLKSLTTEVARQAGWAGAEVYRLGLSLKDSSR